MTASWSNSAHFPMVRLRPTNAAASTRAQRLRRGPLGQGVWPPQRSNGRTAQRRSGGSFRRLGGCRPEDEPADRNGIAIGHPVQSERCARRTGARPRGAASEQQRRPRACAVAPDLLKSHRGGPKTRGQGGAPTTDHGRLALGRRSKSLPQPAKQTGKRNHRSREGSLRQGIGAVFPLRASRRFRLLQSAGAAPCLALGNECP
jgi:hypothetical protein